MVALRCNVYVNEASVLVFRILVSMFWHLFVKLSESDYAAPASFYLAHRLTRLDRNPN